MTELQESIRRVESFISDPNHGLPEDIFLFFTRNTPMINTDLLIKNVTGETLLIWRDDIYDGAGWHIPGGIIRYKETFGERIKKTARNEIGTGVRYNPIPLAINECILPQMKNRGHFISLLFECVLTGPPAEDLKYGGGQPRAGQWMWHDRCPDNMLEGHARIYRNFFQPILHAPGNVIF